MKIAVLYGGVSGEREVSLSSGKGIMEALKQNGHDVVGIDFDPKKLEEIIGLDADLVFIGLHGKYGEDGRIQGLLDMLGIPYVGSGVLASSLAMSKSQAKESFAAAGIPVAKSEMFHVETAELASEAVDRLKQNWALPFVIKPNREGSTLGLTIVRDHADTELAVKHAAESDTEILAEAFIAGRELTVPVLGKRGEERALPVIEIIPKNDLYDYESKYAPGGSEHIVPAKMDAELAEKIQRYAVKAHQALGCETYSRVDFLLTAEGVPYILEVNTLPGMTPTSLFPDAARAEGISYEEMIEEFVRLTVE